MNGWEEIVFLSILKISDQYLNLKQNWEELEIMIVDT